MVSKSQYKWLRQLQLKKYRDKFRLFIAEGNKTVAELLQSSAGFDKLFATENWLQNAGSAFKLQQHQLVEVSAKEMKTISGLISPSEVLGVFHFPELPALKVEQAQSYLLLDAIRDPGNLGTIIRSADWFGMPALICSPDCVDCYNPKVIQSSMGSIVRVPVYYQDLTKLLQGHPAIQSYACVLEGQPLDSKSLDSGFFIIGNEAHGLRKELQEKCNYRVTIPRFGQAESLNAAMAAGILMYELKRAVG